MAQLDGSGPDCMSEFLLPLIDRGSGRLGGGSGGLCAHNCWNHKLSLTGAWMVPGKSNFCTSRFSVRRSRAKLPRTLVPHPDEVLGSLKMVCFSTRNMGSDLVGVPVPSPQEVLECTE